MDNLDNVLAQFAFKKPPKNTPARQSNNKSQPPPSSNKSSDKPDPLTFPTKKVKTSTKDSSNPMQIESEQNNPIPASSTRKKVLKKETVENDQQFDITTIIEAPKDSIEDSDNFLQECNKNKGRKPQNTQNNKKKGGISAATKPDLGVEHDPENTKQGLDSVKLPDWAVEPNIRDKAGKYQGEEGYDPTTLYLPPNALDKMPTLMRKYWEVKSQYFDAVIFIRLHKMYYVYHRDAYTCHVECGTKIFGQTGSTTAYLHPPNLNKHCQKLLEKNYRIILIEPTQDYQDKDEAKLEIYQIITKGTSLEPNLEKFTARYCLILTPCGSNYGFTYFDTTTHEFFMGEFKDTPNHTQLRSLLLTITPVEIVYRDKTLSKELIIMIKGLYWKPILTTLPSIPPKGIESILYRIKSYLEVGQKSQGTANIKVLESLIEMTEEYVESMKNEGRDVTETDCPNYWTFQGVYLSFEYLEYLHLAEIVFKKCRFNLHDLKREKTKNLVLDGQTVNNLELLDVPYLGNATSLFSYMDKTRSAYGKRMFKKWLLEPLRDVERINERLDAVEDLMLDDELTGSLQDKLARLGDIERVIHSIYNFGNRNIFHELDFDTYVKPKIHSFVEALDQLKRANSLIQFFAPYLQRLRSKRLLQLLGVRGEKPIIHKKTKKPVEGIFPVYAETLSKLDSLMVVREGIPVPAPGMDSGYDSLIQEISGVKQEFQAILERTRKRFNCQGITFVHIKQRYELEIPENLVEGTKKPKEYTLTSKKKGYVRFQTQELLDLIEKLEEMELRLHKVILPFIVKCFKEFYSHNSTWQEVIQCLGELDCLASLAQLAKTMPLSCRPQFTQGQIFNLRGVVHPLVAMRSADFVRNDVELEEGQKVFLITGPNMGGKSTLMRSVCIATIMAQMGSFVAAESFMLTVKDRIFTRIGANDNIFEGKSTFFVELEETLNIITEATEESLVIIDELGRGTSTYDGMAIAYAVLKDLADNIGCLCFFATHFHLLLEDFKLFKTVIMYYMDSEFFEDELVRFLYKFKKGSVGNSFGLSVARFAGLPLSVIEKARKRAADMTKELVSVQQFKEITGKFSEIIVALEKEQNKADIDDVINKLANL